MKLSFVIANDKESYVSKEHGISLFSVSKKAAFNEQQIKPFVPFCFLSQDFKNVGLKYIF